MYRTLSALIAALTPAAARGIHTRGRHAAAQCLESSAPADALEIARYAGYGAFSGGPITPGVYQISGDELNFATCGICLLLSTNTDSNGHHDDDYMATAGTVYHHLRRRQGRWHVGGLAK